MTSSVPESRHPFDASHLIPGQTPYQWPSDRDLAAFIAGWERAGERGMIVGPHGSGKTTLLHAITGHPQWAHAVVIQAGRPPLPQRSQLTRRADRFTRSDHLTWSQIRRLLPRCGTLVIDGWDSLRLWERGYLRVEILRSRLAILATSHAPGPWPTLLQTQTNLTVFQSWVRQQLPNHVIPDSMIAHAFELRQGDFREAWFELYDAYERGELSG